MLSLGLGFALFLGFIFLVSSYIKIRLLKKEIIKKDKEIKEIKADLNSARKKIANFSYQTDSPTLYGDIMEIDFREVLEDEEICLPIKALIKKELNEAS